MVLYDIERATRDCDPLVLLERGGIVLDGPAAAVALSPHLDRVFGVRFARREPEQDTDAVLTVPPET